MEWTSWFSHAPQLVLILGAVSGLLLAFRKLTITVRNGGVDQKTALDANIKIISQMRDDLLKDNERLRTRVDALEAHVNMLEKELNVFKTDHEKLKEVHQDCIAENRMLKKALSAAKEKL